MHTTLCDGEVKSSKVMSTSDYSPEVDKKKQKLA
tara:strand:- start:948 stop:1049 length:102 start_codon:yes stop_codon:yes gene_type:complete